MKRIDDLTGAVVRRVEVSRGGFIHIWLERKRGADGRYEGTCEWGPLRVEIPKEPKKRRRSR